LHKVLLIGGWSYNQRDREAKADQLAFMADALGENTCCYMTFMDDLCYTIEPGSFKVYDMRNKVDLAGIDVVFIRGMERVIVSAGYYLSQYCAWAKKPCISEYSIYAPADKVAQAILFLEHGVNFLKTAYSPDSVRLIFQAEELFGYPYILKATLGAHGHDNYLVHSRQEAERIVAESLGVDFLVQEFCPNEFDYRLLIVGKRELLFKRRGDEQTHLNNTSRVRRPRSPVVICRQRLSSSQGRWPRRSALCLRVWMSYLIRKRANSTFLKSTCSRNSEPVLSSRRSGNCFANCLKTSTPSE